MGNILDRTLAPMCSQPHGYLLDKIYKSYTIDITPCEPTWRPNLNLQSSTRALIAYLFIVTLILLASCVACVFWSFSWFAHLHKNEKLTKQEINLFYKVWLQ